MPEKIFRKSIRFLSIVLIGYLFFQGIFTLCNIQRIEEKTFFVRNNPIPALIGIILFSLLFMILKKQRIWNLLQKYGHFILAVCILFTSACMLWWTTHTVFWFFGDMEKVYMCAGGLNGGDFSQWQPGGYAYMWPFQDGLILFVAGLLRIFDVNQTFYIFPVMNYLFVIITILSVCGTLKLLATDKAIIYLQGLFMVFYLPYAFLSMLLYGNHIGYGFAALAIYEGVKYTKDDKIHSLLFSAIYMTLGICFKQNCMILFVGIIAILFLHAIKNFSGIKKHAIGIVMFIMIVIIGISLPERIIETISGMDISGGNSKWAHVAMGLQESDMAPGWYNCYNQDIFIANNYDTEATSKEAIDSIKSSLLNFAQNPGYAWSFFNRKLASEWNNPTFECFHIQNSRNTSLELGSFVKSTINDGGKLNILLIYFLDVMQSVMLFGILMYFLLVDETDYRHYIWALLFIGAFVFWMFWEAKSRYVAPYYMFLFPYAVMGYRALAEQITTKKVKITLLVLAICMGLISVTNVNLVTNSLKMTQDTEDYYEYIHEYNHNFMNLRF